MNKLKANEQIIDGKLHFMESHVVAPKVSAKNADVQKILTEAKATGQRMVLKPRIAAIHAGRTRNDNIYPAEKLKGDMVAKPTPSGVYSFLYPYPKPMLKNHDIETEPLGRIMNAQFVRDSATGSETIIIIPHITDPDAIEKVMDGRYMTVSIGASTDAAICNICGKDIINEGWCEHDRGTTYDGVICGWIVGNLWFNECSFVNVPADSNAIVIDIGEVQPMEAYVQVNDEYYDLGAEHGNGQLKESASVLGLVASVEEPKGGLNTVSKTLSVEEYDKLVVEAAKVPALETQIAEKDQAITEKDALIAEKDVALTEKDTQITEKDTQITEKDNTITILTSEKEALETRVTALEANKQALVDENTNLSAQYHKDLVEKVVNLKAALGKPGVENEEEAIQLHSERAKESLEDSFKDLMGEVKEGKMIATHRARVPNAAGLALPGEPGTSIEGLEDEGLEELDAEKVLKALFSGNRVKKTKGGK